METTKPDRIISWPGCKYRQIKSLMSLLPQQGYEVVCEPFLGSGCFSWQFANHQPELYWAEANAPLRNWWRWLLTETDRFIDQMSEIRQTFIDAGDDRDVFDELRDGFNARNSDKPNDIATAAMLWVLIYQSTNNLARFNQSGGYNQTWGKGRSVPDPYERFHDGIRADISDWISYKIRNNFYADFRECLYHFTGQNKWRPGRCIVYLDPPYIVRTETYTVGSWSADDEADLMKWMRKLDAIGVPWIATNYLAKGDKTHPYSDEIIGRWETYTLERNVDPRPTGQGTPANEVIICGSHLEAHETQMALFE